MSSNNPATEEFSVFATTVTIINCPPAWFAYYDTSRWIYGWRGSRPHYSDTFHQMLRRNANAS